MNRLKMFDKTEFDKTEFDESESEDSDPNNQYGYGGYYYVINQNENPKT